MPAALLAFLVVLLLAPASSSAAVCSETWGGTASVDWDTAANWSGNATPTGSDYVCIPSGTPNAPTLTSTIPTLDGLQVDNGATLTLGVGGSFTLNSLTDVSSIAGTLSTNNSAGVTIAGGTELDLPNGSGGIVGTGNNLDIEGTLVADPGAGNTVPIDSLSTPVAGRSP
jgi:trimeric autotransporter adhesin